MFAAMLLRIQDWVLMVTETLAGVVLAKAAWRFTTSREDISAQIGDTNVPTVIIVGELDRFDSPGRLHLELLPRISQAVVHVVPSMRHLSILEFPDAVSSLITKFFNDLQHHMP